MNKRPMIVAPLPDISTPGRVTKRGVVESPRLGRFPLWFEVDEADARLLNPHADPFALSALLMAMHERRPLHVDGVLTNGLLDGMRKAQSVFCEWWPDWYAPVEVSCAEERTLPRAEDRGALACLSGGVDSSYMLVEQAFKQGAGPFEKLGGGLFLHGFDIPEDDDASLQLVLPGLRAMVEYVGIPLHVMRTNFRRLPLFWVHANGAALDAVLSVLAGGFSVGMIASSHGIANRRPMGSNPWTDELLAGRGFIVRHYGYAVSKVDRARALKGHDPVLRQLRVCWKSKDRVSNCGHCEKCIRTILLMRTAGLGLGPTFPDATDDMIRQVKIRPFDYHNIYLPMLRELQERKATDSWVEALAEAIRRNAPDGTRSWKTRVPARIYAAAITARALLHRARRGDQASMR